MAECNVRGACAACKASVSSSRSSNGNMARTTESRGSRHQSSAATRWGQRIPWSSPRALPLSCVLPPGGLPGEAELLWAIHSLYDDKLKPCSRLLRLRLAEQSGPRGGELKNCDVGQLMALCQSCASLHVEVSDEGRDWCALLPSRSSDFIDVYSEVDCYPEALWHAAEAYFKSLGESNDHKLPRGRYASARELMSRCLPFLMGFALGNICHFVQIAISKRKLLGYVDGGIVPYAHSTSMVKSCYAQDRLPFPAPSTTTNRRASQPKLEVADWETARARLHEILGRAAERGSGLVQLSNVKRLFRSLFQVELSETALGHTTLTGLLNDARFRDICAIQPQGCGHVVVPVACSASNNMLSNFTVVGDAAADAEPLPRMSAIRREGDSLVRPTLPVERTFIHFRLHTPRAIVPKSAHRSHSLPAPAGLVQIQKDHFEGPNNKTGLEAGNGISASKTAVAMLSSSLSVDECWDLEKASSSSLEDRSSPSSPFVLATPSPRSVTNDTQDEVTEDFERCAWEATCHALGLKPLDFYPASFASFDTSSGSGTPEADNNGQSSRVQFCIKEPLVFDEDELQEEVCSLRTPSPLYDNAAAWQWMQTSENKAHKAAAWTDQVTAADDEAPPLIHRNTARVPTDTIQMSDLSCASAPGIQTSQETLVLNLASML